MSHSIGRNRLPRRVGPALCLSLATAGVFVLAIAGCKQPTSPTQPSSKLTHAKAAEQPVTEPSALLPATSDSATQQARRYAFAVFVSKADTPMVESLRAQARTSDPPFSTPEEMQSDSPVPSAVFETVSAAEFGMLSRGYLGRFSTGLSEQELDEAADAPRSSSSRSQRTPTQAMPRFVLL
ncbi:MAG: hypothetical protein ACI9MR_002563 [Myxococcota bacterium]|jgi:hypothetical protein